MYKSSQWIDLLLCVNLEKHIFVMQFIWSKNQDGSEFIFFKKADALLIIFITVSRFNKNHLSFRKFPKLNMTNSYHIVLVDIYWSWYGMWTYLNNSPCSRPLRILWHCGSYKIVAFSHLNSINSFHVGKSQLKRSHALRFWTSAYACITENQVIVAYIITKSNFVLNIQIWS